MRFSIVTATVLAATVLACSPALAGDGRPAADLLSFLSGELPPIQNPQDRDPAVLPPEPGPEVVQVPWKDWADGQRITALRRIVIELEVGPFQLLGGRAGGDEQDISYDAAFASSAVVWIEGGYAFAPFLTVSAGYFGGTLHGKNDIGPISAGGTVYDVNASDWSLDGFLLSAKVRFPFTLIGPELFRFDKARAGMGIVPYFKVGLGMVGWSSVTVSRAVQGSGVWEDLKFYETTKTYAATIGAGFQVRWSWGGLSLEISYFAMGAPKTVHPLADSRDAPRSILLGFGAGVYF